MVAVIFPKQKLAVPTSLYRKWYVQKLRGAGLYRTRKVRILNGEHTAMIPYALLSGVETVKNCMEDKTMCEFDKACVYDEIIPTLDLPQEDLLSYADSVFERFNNPYIKHFCSSISLNSVSKFKVRVLPSILEYIKSLKNSFSHLQDLSSFIKLICLTTIRTLCSL